MKEYRITDFGAKICDKLQTEAIQSALDACFLAGGGKVVLVDDGRTRFKSAKVPVVKGGDFVRGSGTWTLDASAIKGTARLSMEEDGIYVVVSPLGMSVFVR